MLHLRVYGAADDLTEVGEGLEAHGATHRVAMSQGVRAGHILLTAEIHPESADSVLDYLLGAGLEREDIALARWDEIGPVSAEHSDASMIWADVLGQATVNARPIARYLVFMMAAGVIAGFGVIEVNSILIVGAMAVSPDLLPLSAACVGLVSRRARLASRAIVTLLVGLTVTWLMATLVTLVLDLFGRFPAGFDLGESALSGLTTVNESTVGVALTAGVAGILALETRASSAVGVGISITTIPAAAYFGVALALGEADKAWGALAVLSVNVAMLLVGGSLTLVVQRRIARRWSFQ